MIMTYKTWMICSVFMLLALGGCGPTLNTKEEMIAFVAKPENGLTKTVQDEVLEVSTTFYPTALLLKTDTGAAKNDYENSLTFVVKIKPRHKTGGDFLIESANSYDDYKKIIEMLNFSPEVFFQLQIGANVPVKPVLATLENAFESSDSKKLFITFPVSVQQVLAKPNDRLKIRFGNLFVGRADNVFEFEVQDLLHFEEQANK